jgi:rhodanese-related sulfurtransferase
MPFLDSLKKMLGQQQPAASVPSPAAVRSEPQPEPEAIIVPEVAPAALMAEGGAPFLLDCREPYERRQGFIPGSTHIAMREIPYRLDALDRAADIVVYCAHGHRSFDVAGWLISKGYRARSLKGGITNWQMQGGPITREG